MKRISRLLVAIGTSLALTSCAKPQPGQTLEIDLTRSGTVYLLEDSVDSSRISVRSAAGVKSLADLLRMSNTSLRGGLVLGTSNDMRDRSTTSTGRTHSYDCGPAVCKCGKSDPGPYGLGDCIAMIEERCIRGDIWWCSEFHCFCIPKP
jgi:hypothetical protein